MTTVPQLVPSGTWKADPLHSSVRFEVEHRGVSTFAAGFTDYDAVLASSPEGFELEGRVRVESIDIQDDGLRPHVLGADFFDAEAHPEITFRSTTFGAEDDQVIVEGELTLKGTTRTVSARGSIGEPVASPFGGELAALRLEAEIDRTDFGLDWQMEMPSGGNALANEVKLLVSLELGKEG